MSERDDANHGARESVSGSVLRDLFANPIDQGYRAGNPQHGNSWWKRLASLLAVILLTMTATWAAVELRDARTATDSPTQRLREQVEVRIGYQETVQGTVDELREEIDALHASALPADAEGTDEKDRLAIASSSSAVSGPGLIVTLDDSQASSANERLRDFDLQVVTNSLWAGGAEAIDINGERLTSTSAIRSAGSAILVNLTPLIPPYSVTAIGDPTELQIAFTRSGASTHAATLRDTFGVRVAIDSHDELDVPAARDSALRFAQEIP